MKLSQIEQIIEVANVGTISQASVNLFISQPNLSLSIKNAENELGIKIFTRTSSGMVLTQQGVEFVERAKEILMQVDALEYACRQHSLPLRFELQIASIGYRVVDIEVANLLRQYSTNYISIDMMDSSGIKLLDYVANNRAELGFCTVYDFTKQVMLRQMSIRQLEYHMLCKTVAGIYVGTNNKRFGKNEKTVDLEKISELPMVCLSQREFNAHTVTQQLQKKYSMFVGSHHEIKVRNFGMLRNMVNLVDSYAIASYIDIPYGEAGFYPDLRFIPFEPDTIHAEFGYVQRENTVKTLLANELVKNLTRTLGRSNAKKVAVQ